MLTAADGEHGYSLARSGKPDLILLDLMLPRMSGYELCRKLRAEGVMTPIVMLTRGATNGSHRRARSWRRRLHHEAVLGARAARAHQGGPSARAGAERAARGAPVRECDRRFPAVRGAEGGRPVELTRKEFGLLRLLAARSGEPVTRDDLLNEVWGYDATPTTRTVDNHVASLRAKLEDNPSDPRHLFTVHGVGYKWVQ